MNNLLRVIVFLLSVLPSLVYSQDFVTIWQTDNAGTSANDQITIPGTGTYTIDWVEVGNPGNNGSNAGSGTTTVTFPSAGTYEVSISGSFTRIQFNNSGDILKITSVEEWGNIAWSSFQNAFYGCSNLEINASDSPDLSAVTTMQSAFRDCATMNSSLNAWDVSNITNMNSTFRDATSYNQSMNSWDVTSVTNMNNMFRGATSFNGRINNWDVSSVTRMNNMFRNASSYNRGIGAWDVSSVTTMASMFRGASLFNRNLNNWDVSSVTTMNNMFRDASNFNGNIAGWVTTNLGNTNSMFRGASSFNRDISGWNVSNVTNMGTMFRDAVIFDQAIGAWNVSSATNMSNMFRGATAFNQDISGWNVSNVTNMGSMFRDASSFNQPIGSWNVSNVTNMANILRDASGFDQGLGGWNISAVTSLNNAFNGTAISIANYDNTLIAWDALTVQPNVPVGATGLVYCNGETARDNLTNNDGWTFSGDILDCSLTLPISLVSFDAERVGINEILVSWVTETEINNHYFEIQASTDGKTFTVLKTVEGAGNSTELLNYQTIVYSSSTEIVYLRLRQVDFDGQSETFRPVAVKPFEQVFETELRLFPNPGSGEQIGLQLMNFEEGSYTLQLTDLSGKILQSQLIQISNNEPQFNQRVQIREQLKKGTYLIRLVSSSNIYTERYIVL